MFSCETKQPQEKAQKEPMMLPAVNAPEINTKFGWLNSDTSYSIKDFKGKIVLLDFWTFGCINCQHILPDLKRLEQEYAQELVVIGIHSAKFGSEKSSDKIKKAIEKFKVTHPVVNDADFTVWNSYAVNAWPTFVLINPDGKVVAQKSGEGFYAPIKQAIDGLKQAYGDKISTKVFDFGKREQIAGPLLFPSKIITDSKGHFYVSDSGHNRILVLDENGKVIEIIGQGSEGNSNGSFADASFNEPHGMALNESKLYIADSKNNLIRIADLTTKTVATAAGSGKKGYYYFESKLNENVDPNSPWDLTIANNTLYIADAGNHQILKMDLATNAVFRLAGTGREALADGTFRESAFNQPSGICVSDNFLYVADPEASAVRRLDLKNNRVETLVGKGLFDFGDKDGKAGDALLQHCVGIEVQGDKLFIADTYNGKIKQLDLGKLEVTTFATGFNEPNDVLVSGDQLWITDTNNHQLIKLNLATGKKQVVNLTGI
ncbi:MAG TPA: thioredoxin-like domain-containing protein [Cytophagaceae bacterium]